MNSTGASLQSNASNGHVSANAFMTLPDDRPIEDGFKERLLVEGR